MLVAHDPPEALCDGVEGHRRPTQGHRAALPVLHLTRPVTQRRVPVVDQVRHPQAASQLARQFQAVKREKMLISLANRARGAGPLTLQPRRVLLDLGRPFLHGVREARSRGDGCVAERLAVFNRCFRDSIIFSLWFSVKFPALRHAYLLTARLKSRSIGLPSAVSRMFDGFTSPWMTSRHCAWSRASASRAVIQAMAWQSVRLFRISRADAPD